MSISNCIFQFLSVTFCTIRHTFEHIIFVAYRISELLIVNVSNDIIPIILNIKICRCMPE